jgi:hypothetical protein
VHTQDEPVTAQSLASIDHGSAPSDYDSGADSAPHAAAVHSAPAQAGMQAMDALLTLAAAGPQEVAAQPPQDHDIVKEALTDHASQGLIDSIVNHFVLGEDQGATVVTTGDFAPAILFDAVDSHSMAVAIVDVTVDNAALAIAAAHA